MIINIRNEISKSFFFIISSLLPIRSWQVLNSLVFPTTNYTIMVKLKQANKLNFQNKFLYFMLYLQQLVNYYYLLIVYKKSYSTSSSQAPLGNLFELFELLDIESIERLVFFVFGKKSQSERLVSVINVIKKEIYMKESLKKRLEIICDFYNIKRTIINSNYVFIYL